MTGNPSGSLDKQDPVHRCLCDIRIRADAPRKDNCFPCNTGGKLCHFECRRAGGKSAWTACTVWRSRLNRVSRSPGSLGTSWKRPGPGSEAGTRVASVWTASTLAAWGWEVSWIDYELLEEETRLTKCNIGNGSSKSTLKFDLKNFNVEKFYQKQSICFWFEKNRSCCTNLKAGLFLLTEKGILFVLKSVDLVGYFIQESWRVHLVLSSFFGRHVQLDSHGFHELFNFSQSEFHQLIPLRVGRPEKLRNWNICFKTKLYIDTFLKLYLASLEYSYGWRLTSCTMSFDILTTFTWSFIS